MPERSGGRFRSANVDHSWPAEWWSIAASFRYLPPVAEAGVSDAAELTAVVTGAACGFGRDIAIAIGAVGATVYVAGWWARAWDDSGPPGTVEETAWRVCERGGHGLPVTLDHADDGAVMALFERVRVERGRLDLLVVNAFDGPVPPSRGGPFWTIPLGQWQDLFGGGVREQLVVARLAAPLLIARRGLIVLTGYCDPDAEVIAEHLFFDVAMNATSRLAHDLRPHGVTALALAARSTRTDTGTTAHGKHSDDGEFVGRAVRALLEDSWVADYAGRTVSVAELAERYGFGACAERAEAVHESPAPG